MLGGGLSRWLQSPGQRGRGKKGWWKRVRGLSLERAHNMSGVSTGGLWGLNTTPTVDEFLGEGDKPDLL